jgi:hypothetical protein
MKLIYFFILLIFCQLSFLPVLSASCSNSTISNTLSSETKVEIPVKLKKNKKKSPKTDAKPFPVFAFTATVLGALALGAFALGIYLKLVLYIGIIAALLAIAALVLGILGLKKGENKTLCYIGILLGAVGIIGSIFYLISVASAP